MAETIDLSKFVERRESGTAHMTLAVDGVGCAGCIRKIESGLGKLPGVIDARLNFTQRRLAVDWHDNETGAADIIQALAALGYQAHPFAPERVDAEESRQEKSLLRYLGVSGFAAMNVMLLSVSVWAGDASDMTDVTRDLFHWLSALIVLPAAAYAGQPFYQSAWRALRNRTTNMDVPITIGVTLALGLSLYETATHAVNVYFDSAIMLLFFLLCGRTLDLAMRRKTKIFAGNLASLKGDYAHRLGATGALSQVPVAALQPGDRVLIRPGERIPADGGVLDGCSAVDEGVVTGETLPRAVAPGASVYAGSINGAGALTVKVIAAGAGTLVDEVERLLEKAIAAKSRTVRLADRAARLYAPVVHSAAALTAIGWLISGASLHAAIVTAVAVLIITCPCAIALAIPAVQVVAAGQLFRARVILNAGDALERLAEIDTVVFDKTGTLTLPEPVVDDAAIPPELLDLAARLALSSHHPLATALARRARERVAYPGAIEEPGSGVRALIDGQEARLGSAAFCGLSPAATAVADSGSSAIAFAHAGKTALIPIRQSLRIDAIAVVQALAARGLDLIVLSGDRPEAVAPVAKNLGIKQWHAGLTPAEKIAAIDRLKAQGRRVLMVGDGLNDAPALAAAHASLSPISAAHLTQAHADALFLGGHLAPVLYTVQVARRARMLMRQNLALAAIYNMLAVPVAMAGLVTPLIAALAMSGSSILVTLNAQRARFGTATEPPMAAAQYADADSAAPLQPAMAEAMLPPAAIPAFAPQASAELAP